MANFARANFSTEASSTETLSMETPSTNRRRSAIRWLFCLLVMAAFLVSLVPLLAEARYNLPISDDLTVISKVLGVWEETHSLPTFLSACVTDTLHLYNTWQGTFAANYIIEVSDVLLFNSYPMLTPAVGILAFVLANLFFGWVLLKKILGTDDVTFLTVTFLALFLSIQFCPSAYEAFYWLFAMLLYVGSYCVSLVLMGLLLLIPKLKSNAWRVVLYVLCLVLALRVGGGTQPLLPVMLLVLLFNLVLRIRQKNRLDIVFAALALGVYIACTVLNIIAPGNYARLDYETGAAAAAMSPVSAVLLSCVHAFGEMLYRLEPGMLLFVLVTAVFTAPFLPGCGFAFKKPWLAFLLSFGVYASLFTALVYTKNNVGPLRAQNLYYFALYPFMAFNTVYFLGAATRASARRTGKAGLPETGERLLSCVFRYPLIAFLIVGCLVFGSVVQRGLQKTWSYAAYHDLSSGWARDYYSARSAELDGTSPGATESVVRPNIIDGN